ncbi:hypothetical protein EGI22_15235, partial [Lacihabitans sp. LS3-19]
MKKLKLIRTMKKLALLLFLVFSSGIGFSKTLITSAMQVGNTNSITIIWGETDVNINPPSVTLNRYQIKYKPVGGLETTIDNISSSLRTYTLTNLISGQTYEVELIEVIRVVIPPSPFNPFPYIDTAIGSGISSVALNVPPIAACTPLTVSIGSNCQATVTAAQIGAGSSDPNGDDITYSISPVGPFGVGVYNISLTVTDIYGSSSTCTNTLTVVDNQAPVVRLKDAVINLSSDGIAALTLAQINDGITDNCNISSIELSKTQFGCDNMGKNLVSVSVKDAAGNQTTQWCTVTVLDVTAPQVSTKNAVIFLNFDGYATLNPEDIDFGTFDKCSVHKLSLSKSVFSCENVGFNSVDLIATDASGNVSKASAVVKVVDNTLPYQSSKKLEIELDKGAELILDKNTPNLNIYDACGLKSIDIISEIITCETKSKTVNIRATDKNDNVLVTDLSLVVKDTKFP